MTVDLFAPRHYEMGPQEMFTVSEHKYGIFCQGNITYLCGFTECTGTWFLRWNSFSLLPIPYLWQQVFNSLSPLCFLKSKYIIYLRLNKGHNFNMYNSFKDMYLGHTSFIFWLTRLIIFNNSEIMTSNRVIFHVKSRVWHLFWVWRSVTIF